jgi:hypothetical protein
VFLFAWRPRKNIQMFFLNPREQAFYRDRVPAGQELGIAGTRNMAGKS